MSEKIETLEDVSQFKMAPFALHNSGDHLGQYLQSTNASDSSDHVVKIADCLGCLGWRVPTGCKNSRRRKIVKIPDS